MPISLSPEMLKKIEDHMKQGKFKSPDDVVLAALAALEQVQQFGDFEPGELERLIEEGEKSGPGIDADTVFAELRELKNRRKNKVG
jgi:Arc/MetJ-type ribon-helix-helix transcriptional regulator